jgi:hypothetical protein
MIAELQNPSILDITGRDSDTSKKYNLLSEKSSDQWLKSKIDTYLEDARSDSLYKSYVFFGITHFGVYPGGGLVTMYDRENYDYFKKYLNTEIGELNNYITAQTKVIGNTYTAQIKVKPEALGFVPSSAMHDLNFLIDIVDSDREGKQSTVLSTETKRKWADINTFSDAYLRNPIKVNIDPDFPFLGGNKKNSVIEKELRSRIYDTYIYTDQGWRGIQRTPDNFECELYLVGTYLLPNIQRYYIEMNDLSASKMFVGNRNLNAYSFAGEKFIEFGDDKLIDADNLIQLFQLANGKLAAIVYEQKWMHNGKWDVSKLLLVKENEDDILIGRADGMSFLLDDTIHIDAQYTNSDDKYPWINMRLFESSNTMFLYFKDKAFEVQWNDAGSLQCKIVKQGDKYFDSNSQLNDGLIGYWPFDGNANDASGNNNHGKPVGAVLTQDRNGYLNSAYYLDGHDDYIHIPHSDILKPQLPVSVAAWIRCDGQGGGILHTNYKENIYMGVFIKITDDTDEIFLSYGCNGPTSDEGRRSKTTTTRPDGTWFHFIGVIRGPRDMSIYINGQDAGGHYSGTGRNVEYDSSPCILGKVDSSRRLPPFHFKGALDQVRIYNHALTDEEALLLYLSGQ